MYCSVFLFLCLIVASFINGKENVQGSSAVVIQPLLPIQKMGIDSLSKNFNERKNIKKHEKLYFTKKKNRFFYVNQCIRIGTRDSPLAMKQTEKIKKKLQSYFKKVKKKVKIIIKPIKTIGDKILDKSINQFGGKGIFTKELDEQLLNNNVDICVHSLKDIPVILPHGISVSCFLKRDTINDAFLSVKYKNFDEMNKKCLINTQNKYLWETKNERNEKGKDGNPCEHNIVNGQRNTNETYDSETRATVATSSLRRMSHIKYLYKNLNICTIRGNINTRLTKLFDGYCDALILAMCGLERLVNKRIVKEIMVKGKQKEDMEPYIINYNNKNLNLSLLNIEKINENFILPALCQGIIAVTVNNNNTEMIQNLRNINDKKSEIMAKVERTFLSEIEGNCMMPIGGYTKIKKDKINFHAIINDVDGVETFKVTEKGPLTNYENIGKLAAEKIKQKIGLDKFKLIKEQTERYYRQC